MTDIARQYALAVFSLAEEKKELNSFLSVFDSFQKSLDEKTLHFFNHPIITKIEKKEVIKNVSDNELLTNFLCVLVDNDRINLASSIYLALVDIVNLKNKVLCVDVFTKTKLKEKDKLVLIQKLEEKTKKSVTLKENIDEEIISGYRLEYDGFIYDETINKELEDLKTNLKRN